jgi:hypothetical protein
MNRERFIALVKNPALIKVDDAPFLEELLKEFPFFQTAHLLAARCYKVSDSIHLQKQIKNAAAHIIDRKVLYNLIENFQIAENFELAKQDQNVEVKKEDNAIDQAEINAEVEQDVELKPVSLTNASEVPITPEKEELSASLEEMPDLNVQPEITIEPDNIATAAEKNIEDEKLQNDDWQEEEKPIEFIPPVEKITGFAAIVEAEIPLEREIKLALAETIYLQEFEQNSGNKIDLLTPIEKEEIAVKTEEKVESEVEKEVQVLHHQQTTDFVAWLKNLQLNENNNVNPSQAKPQNEGEKLIDAFIEKPIQRAKLVKQEFYSPVNMAKQSVSDNDFFVTETLAKIYIKQGNLAKAIKVYQNLSLKNPEKNNIFATQIKILKEQLHNKTGK